MIITILAILKARTAYLPLDPDTPAARTKYILEDAHIRFLLTDSPDRFESGEDAVYVNNTLTDWHSSGMPRRCGVSAFSLCGTNVHIVLQEYQQAIPVSITGRKSPIPVVISAKNQKGIKALVENYRYFLQQANPDLETFAYMTNACRWHLACRLALIVKNRDTLISKLDHLLQQGIEKNQELDIYFHINSSQILDEKAQESPETMGIEYNDNTLSSYTQLQKLCLFYTRGGKLDWQKLYAHRSLPKISIPSYPFTGERCWLDYDIPVSPTLFQTIEWQHKPYPSETVSPTPPSTIIIVRYNNEKLSGEYIRNNNERCRIVIIEPSKTFEKVKQDHYRTPLTISDLAGCLQDLGDIRIDKILHFLSISDLPDRESAEPAQELQNAYGSLFSLYKALLRQAYEYDIELLLISSRVYQITGDDFDPIPANRTLFALGRIINLECPNLHCRCIDMDQTFNRHDLEYEIELVTENFLTAFRRGNRYISYLTQLDFSETTRNEITVRNTGVYLIAGGTGEIGIRIVKHLADNQAQHIAVLSRTQIPDRQEWKSIEQEGEQLRLIKLIQKFRKIEESGTTLHFFQGDVADKQKMAETIQTCRSMCKQINGIIFSAGTGTGQAGKVLADLTRQDLIDSTAAKIHGMHNLLQFTRDDPLDFFIAFSSPITIIGGYGAGSYILGNAYLDALCTCRLSSRRKIQVISWAPWQHNVDRLGDLFVQEKQMFHVLKDDTAITAFKKILNYNCNYVIIGKLNYSSEIFLFDHKLFNLSPSLRTQLSHRGEQDQELLTYKNENVRIKGEEDFNEYSANEILLAQIWSALLGYEEIDINADFFELGGHSILAIKLQLILAKMDYQLKYTDIYKYPTIAKLSRQL